MYIKARAKYIFAWAYTCSSGSLKVMRGRSEARCCWSHTVECERKWNENCVACLHTITTLVHKTLYSICLLWSTFKMRKSVCMTYVRLWVCEWVWARVYIRPGQRMNERRPNSKYNMNVLCVFCCVCMSLHEQLIPFFDTFFLHFILWPGLEFIDNDKEPLMYFDICRMK